MLCVCVCVCVCVCTNSNNLHNVETLEGQKKKKMGQLWMPHVKEPLLRAVSGTRARGPSAVH